MVLAIAGVAALAWWDARREAQASLDDFAEEQARLADALSRVLAERLAVVERDALDGARDLQPGQTRPAFRDLELRGARIDDPAPSRGPGEIRFRLARGGRGDAVDVGVPVARLVTSLKSAEHPGAVRVLLTPPGSAGPLGLDGAPAPVAVARALEQRGPSVRLPRDLATSLGLPARAAMAGVAAIDAGALGSYRIAVVTTARGEREREDRAAMRPILSVAVAAGLVLVFGGLAVRRRTRELELAHALELAARETARDEALARADKLATLGALATGVAHEVSTPLGVILARAEELSRRATDDRGRRSADLIVTECGRIDRVVRGMLGLARGGSPDLAATAPSRLAEEAAERVAHRFAKAGVDLRTDVDARVPDVACDPLLFGQVLINLLLNACDACEPGGRVELSVSAEGGVVRFVIVDDGVGIDPGAAARAAEPFFTTKPEGTGLGLAIASEIVEHHRGRLAIAPRADGRGTRAVVELPAEAP